MRIMETGPGVREMMPDDVEGWMARSDISQKIGFVGGANQTVVGYSKLGRNPIRHDTLPAGCPNRNNIEGERPSQQRDGCIAWGMATSERSPVSTTSVQGDAIEPMRSGGSDRRRNAATSAAPYP